MYYSSLGYGIITTTNFLNPIKGYIRNSNKVIIKYFLRGFGKWLNLDLVPYPNY